MQRNVYGLRTWHSLCPVADRHDSHGIITCNLELPCPSHRWVQPIEDHWYPTEDAREYAADAWSETADRVEPVGRGGHDLAHCSIRRNGTCSICQPETSEHARRVDVGGA